jgi:archaellum biogenesis protein FlaJ (TadC family)
MFPKKTVQYVQKLLIVCDLDYDAEEFMKTMLLYGIGFGIGFGLIFFSYSTDIALISFAAVTFLFEAVVFGILLVASNKRVNMIEEALPDLLGLMASDIRSGVTYDRALMLSARREFGPLAKEIERAAKETLTGKPITDALMGMTGRVPSEMFSKTIRLIVEGLNSGGNLADLLENTALDIRRFGAMRKEVSATVLVYQLFMMAAAAIGAPMIYAVTTFLIRVIATTQEKIGATTMGNVSFMPFFKGGASLSPEIVFWFAVAALFVTAFFGSLAVGVIARGKESEGLPFFPIILAISMGVFFVTRYLMDFFTRGLFFS